MKTISIDIETYSNIDLTKSGVYKYIEGDFEILLIAYAYKMEIKYHHNLKKIYLMKT